MLNIFGIAIPYAMTIKQNGIRNQIFSPEAPIIIAAIKAVIPPILISASDLNPFLISFLFAKAPISVPIARIKPL